MKHFLIKFDKNWSDEFDCQQFVVREFESYQHCRSALFAELEDNPSGYFGSNQGFEEGELTLNDFDITPIPKETANLLAGLFGKYAFGIGVL